jgi:hypothetical protein
MVFNRSVLLLVLFFIPASLFANRLYFPQVAFGGGYTTTIVLMNAGAANVSSQLQVYGQTGALVMSVPVTVTAGGSTRLTVSDPGTSIISSWGMLDAGTGTVQGAAIFESRSTNGALITTAGVFGIEAGNGFTVPVDVTGNGSANTGIAIANVNTSSEVTVVLQLISESGSGSPSVTGYFSRFVTLAPGQQIAEFVTSFWPQLADGFRGSLAVAVLDIAQRPNSLILTGLSIKEGLLSALPAIPGTNSCSGCWDY